MSAAAAPPPWQQDRREHRQKQQQQQRATPTVLRLFEAGDLPTTTRGTFSSHHSPAAMIIRMSRQTGDVAGITDNPNAKNEPKLKRFSHYSSLTTARSPSSLSFVGNSPATSSAPMSTRSTRRELFINHGGTQRSSVDSGNWTLRDRPPELRSSSVMSSNITVVPVGDFEDNGRNSKSSWRVSVPGSVKSQVLTNGHMRLVKSGSVGDFVIDGNEDDCMSVRERMKNNGERRMEQARNPRCSTSVGRRVPFRKPLTDVFSRSVVYDSSSSHGSTSDHRPLVITSPADIVSSALPSSFATRLAIDVDSSFGTEGSASPSSASPTTSSVDRRSGSITRKSCPDLLRPDEEENVTPTKPSGTSGDRTTVRSRKIKEKRRAALVWQRKLLKQWTLDDIILWLQHIQLDEVASLMIGYDLTGADLEKWDHQALENLGVDDELVRQCVLKELAALRRTQQRDRSNPASNRVVKKTTSLRVPLFNLVRSSSYDQIVAVETSLTTRDISVAETQQGCLQVTKVNGAVPLKEGDCLLEINSKSAHGVRSLMFTKLVALAAGDPIRLVVLRRHAIDDDANDNDSISTDYSTPRITRKSAIAEQLSTGSSGVSSSEIADSPSFDDTFHVLHF